MFRMINGLLGVLCALITMSAWAGPARAATLGKVVAIGGHAADLALDEGRGVLYVANFTANRVDVLGLRDGTIQTSFNVSGQPASLSISPDGQFLLIGHYGAFAAPLSPANGLTLIDLNSRARQTMALSSPVLGVAFGNDGVALVVTSTQFLLFDPLSVSATLLDTIANVAAKSLPVAPASFPPDITNASIASSGDGSIIYGMGGSSGTFTFKYDVGARRIGPGGIVLASGVLGPRVVSLNQDGSRILAGWVMIDESSNFINYFKLKTNQFSVGSTAFDSSRRVVYAQIPQTPNETPVLQVLDADNLAVIEKFKLRENLSGKSLLSTDSSMLYAISESGVTIFPVGSFDRLPRLAPSVEDLVVRGNSCERRTTVQEFELRDPGGNRTAFTITPGAPGVSVQPASGVTPARIRISVDPSVFVGQKGTVQVPLAIDGAAAVNIPNPVRVLVNFHDPDQRGTFVNVPGTLTDVIADPDRNRFYVLRQDTNQVLVFDGSSYTRVGSLKTYNSPTSLALTMDKRYLLVGHDAAQVAAVFDLDTLEQQPYISTDAGSGNEARSIAVSANDILSAAVDYQGKGHIIRLDLATRRSYQYPTLGVYNNDISPSTVAVGSASGSSILFASADGGLMLYNASVGTFTISRKEASPLLGSYASSNYDSFAVGNAILNASLVPTARVDSGSGTSSGFVFVEGVAFRTVSTATSDPGQIQRIDVSSEVVAGPFTRLAEAPVASSTRSPFTRTLAYLPATRSLVSLSVSGFLVVPWTYGDAAPPPRLKTLVNAADRTPSVAPGSLVSIFGENLSPVNIATQELPLPTALGESCLTVNGLPVPMLFVSPSQINAQLPFTLEGNATIVLRTPGGVSDNLNTVISPTAPGIFRSELAGAEGELATVLRTGNGELVSLSNPIHRGDRIKIVLTGLGRTNPTIEAGVPAPASPLLAAAIPPTVTIGGVGVGVRFAGLTPGQVGVYEIDAEIPGYAPIGLGVPLTITGVGASTTVNVRVVDK